MCTRRHLVVDSNRAVGRLIRSRLLLVAYFFRLPGSASISLGSGTRTRALFHPLREHLPVCSFSRPSAHCTYRSVTGAVRSPRAPPASCRPAFEVHALPGHSRCCRHARQPPWPGAPRQRCNRPIVDAYLRSTATSERTAAGLSQTQSARIYAN